MHVLANRVDPGEFRSDVPDIDSLQAARERGKHLALQEWEEPENLTRRNAAENAARSDLMINQDRQAGRVYAVVPVGKERGFR